MNDGGPINDEKPSPLESRSLQEANEVPSEPASNGVLVKPVLADRFAILRRKIVVIPFAAIFLSVWWIYEKWPRLDISEQRAIAPKDPHGWVFSIRNSGALWAGDTKGS